MSLSFEDIYSALLHGGFHGHAGGMNGLPPWDEHGMHKSAIEEAQNRLGSICADHRATEAAIAEFFLGYLDCQTLYFSQHDRNGEGPMSVFGAFEAMAKETYRKRPQDWPLYNVSYKGDYQGLSQSSLRQILHGTLDAAMDLIMYGDQHLINNWAREEDVRQQYPTKIIFSGLEISLLANGDLSSRTALYAPSCQYFILAPHVNYDTHGFGELRQNPQAYSQFLAQAIDRHEPHIVAHPGYKCGSNENEFRHDMDWASIANACIANGTLLEVNTSVVYNQLWKNPAKYTADADTRHQLYAKTPIFNDPSILDALEQYTDQGLVLAISNDRHFVPPPEYWSHYKDWTEEHAVVLMDMLANRNLRLANNWSVEEQGQFFQK